MSAARFDDSTLETVGRAIAASMWGEEQARTFFEIKTRNVHYGLAVNAARDALLAYAKVCSATAEAGDAQ
jgi:hypothetical protein